MANDVTGSADDATTEQVASWFGHIVGVARAVEPQARIFCLEITPTLARWKAWPTIQAVKPLDHLSRQRGADGVLRG